MIEVGQVEKALVAIHKVCKSDPLRSDVKECLKIFKSYNGAGPAAFFAENTCIIDTIVSLLGTNKVLYGVLELIHKLLVSEMLPQNHVLHIISELDKPAWTSQGQMKILQMAFYFVRYDIYSGNEAFLLLKFILECLDPNDSHLDSAARPIGTLLLDKILHKSIPSPQSVCDIGLDRLRLELDGTQDAPPVQAGHANVGRCRSQENIKDEKPANPDIVVAILELVESAVTNSSAWGAGYLLPHLLKYRGIMTAHGVEEFVRTRLFSVFTRILKYGRCEDKEAMYASLCILQAGYRARFGHELHQIYERLPRYYEDRNESYLNFIHRLFEIFTKQQALASDQPGESAEIPLQLYDIFEKVLEDLNVAKRADAAKFRFVEQTLGLFDGNLEFYNNTVDKILTKIREAKEVALSVDSFMEAALKSVAACRDRALFERMLCICSAETVLKSAVALRGFMEDAWDVVFIRTAFYQRRDHLFPYLGDFSPQELAYVIKYVSAEEVELVFEHSRRRLANKNYFPVAYALLHKANEINTLSKLIVQFYSGLVSENTGAHAISNDYLAHKDLDPEKIAGSKILEIDSAESPAVPLSILKSHAERNPNDYSKVLACCSEVIQIASITKHWNIIFAIVDSRRDDLDAQVPLTLSIVEGFLAELEDKYIATLLDIVKRMCQSPNNNTVLNALFIYQEIGEFLLTRGILSPNTDPLSGFDVQMQNRKEIRYAHGEASIAKQRNTSANLWKAFVLAGAVIMRDARAFIALSIIRYIFVFLKARHSNFTTCDFKFIEKVFFSQLVSQADEAVSILAIGELSDYAKSYSLGGFSEQYTRYLIETLFEEHVEKARMAFKALRQMIMSKCAMSNEVICDSAEEIIDDGTAIEIANGASRPFKSCTNVEPGKGVCVESSFIIKHKRPPVDVSGVVPVFTALLGRMAEQKNSYLAELLKLMPLFAYTEDEVTVFIELLYKVLLRDDTMAKEIIICVEDVCTASGHRHLGLVCFAQWLNDDLIGGYKAEGWASLPQLLLVRISAIMRKEEWGAHCECVLASLISYASDETADGLIDAIVHGCTEMKQIDDYHAFMAFACQLFSNIGIFNQSKTRERKLTEFMAFYHNILCAYHSSDAFGKAGRDKLSVVDPYAIVLLCISKPYRQLRLKCYQILFIDIAYCRGMLLNRLQTVFRSYATEFMAIGESIDGTRVIEVLYCLRCLALLKDTALIDALKVDMTELFVCRDADILEAVKQCFQIMFTCATPCLK